MKKYILSLLVFVFCLNQSLKQNEDIIEIHLAEEMTRKEYLIKQNQTYKFIKSNNEYIYFIEIQNNTEIIDTKNDPIKDITFLSTPDSYIIIHLKNDSIEEKKVYSTSVANNINIFYYKAFNGDIHTILDKNGIIILQVPEDEDKILNLDSFEKTLSFYYYKYDYNSMTPNDLNPINKSLFTKCNEIILTLDNASFYFIFAEIYKFVFTFNLIDLFISSKNVNKNLLLKYNYFYLQKSNHYYNISFAESKSKRILKLSKKSHDSVIVDLYNNIVLSINNTYYELTEDNINNGIQLKVNDNNCFIEVLLSSEEDSEIIDDYSKENYKLTKVYTIIKIPKVKSKYGLYLSTNNEKKFKKIDFGFLNKISKNSFFYNYTLSFNSNVGGREFHIGYDIPDYNNLEMDDDEYQIFEIFLSKEQLQNDIFLTYNPTSVYKYLLKPIEEQKSEYIIGNISSILDKFYIYKDIAKKPPKFKNLENYHHEPIDLISALNNIRKKNQTYLSLYQDIERVLRSVRDGHLDIQLQTLENNIDIFDYMFCLPFLFYIETDKIGNPIIKIKLYKNCVNNYSNKELLDKFIKAHYNIPIKFINKTDPFEYIQNFGKYQRYKSRHAQFTENLVGVYKFDFNIFPYDYSELTNIEFEFENGDIFSYDYISKSSSFTDVDQKEFKDFYNSLINNQANGYLIPNIFDVKRLFLQKKGILLDENNSNKIVWDIQTKDGNLKCRVDNEYKYNVFLQTSFDFESMNNAIEIMIKCSELFYSNDYKIIGIENFNGGGNAILFEIWHQLLQQKTLGKSFRALIYNEKAFEFIDLINLYTNYINFANIETCKYIGSIKELGKTVDDYGYNEEMKQNIIHNRTNIYDYSDRFIRKTLEKIRKKNFENKKFLKNPTDILIYTDSLCFSAGSDLLKAIQETGGAIIVGFNGNPKLPINEFDGSQSPSSKANFPNQEYNNLNSLGYKIYGITYAESFDDSYQNPNPIPREYTINAVDERVPIYAPYSDELYDDFIFKAKEIFNKYEINCNKNNSKLLLDDEKCIFNDKRQGGHPCGEDGKWNMDKCEAYYCELGYYYDQFKKECVLDICTHGNESDIYLDDEIYNNTKEYELNPDNEMVFHLQDDNYFYFFEANINNDNIFSFYKENDLIISNKSNFYMFEFKKKEFLDFDVNVNYYKTLKQKTILKLTTIKREPYISIISYMYNDFENAMIEKENRIYNIEPKKDHILYTVNYFKNLNIYYSTYNSDIEPKDIVYINKNKFNICSNKLIDIKKSDIGILIYQAPQNYSLGLIYINSKDIGQNIKITKNRFIYLNKKDFIYNLNLDSVSKNLFIKLNRETLDAEIEILDGKNGILNKNNKYYFIEKNIKKLSLKLKNDNSAFIELLYEYEFSDGINLDINQKKFELKKGFYCLKYKKSDKIKSIIIDIKSKDNLSGYIFPTIEKDNYSTIFPDIINYNINYTKCEFIFPEDKIDNNEDFSIFIQMNISEFNLAVDINKEKNEENNNTNNKFPIWAIILIVVLGIIIIFGVVFIIMRKYKERNIEIDINEQEILIEEK